MSVRTAVQRFARRALGIGDSAPTMEAREVIHGRVGRWDSKNVDRLNQAHWSKATGLPINAELAYASNFLRAQSEYEISCNPIVEGLVNTYCVDVVGPDGPTYRVQSSDSEYNVRREMVWRKWWRHAGANRQLSGIEILTSWVKSLWKAGEFGTQLIEDGNADGPIKLRLLPVHMHRLLTPPEQLGDPDVALGVRRDRNRCPVAYYISEPYLFGPFEVYTGKFNEVPFRDFIHGYRIDEEDQVRGVPWLASCLDTIAQLRDWDKAMLDAAESLAKTGVLWSLKNPDTPPTVIQSSAPMERGQHTFGPPGYEPEQLAPTQPSADQQSWRTQKKYEIGRGVNMPGMIIDLDSSRHNYSSARFDNQPYWRSIGTVQAWIGRIALDRIEAAVMREAELAGELNEAPDDIETAWGWIKPPHVDPTKESTSERAYLQNQTVSWSESVIAQGKDPDRVLAELKRDKERLEKAGLPTIPGIPDPSKAAGSGAGGAGIEKPAAKVNGTNRFTANGSKT
jgi:capsid protein